MKESELWAQFIEAVSIEDAPNDQPELLAERDRLIREFTEKRDKALERENGERRVKGYAFYSGKTGWMIICPQCFSKDYSTHGEADALLTNGNGDVVPCDHCGEDVK